MTDEGAKWKEYGAKRLGLDRIKYRPNIGLLDPNPNNPMLRGTLRPDIMHGTKFGVFSKEVRGEWAIAVDKKDTKPWSLARYCEYGELNWKSHKQGQTPAHLHADNWKPVTMEELRAYKERSEITGRNRRYFWKLQYDPKYGDAHFKPHVSDAQYAKYNRIHNQFFILFNRSWSNAGFWSTVLKFYVVPLTIGWCYMKYQVFNQPNWHYSPVVDLYGLEPYQYVNGGRLARNQITQDDKSYLSAFLNLWLMSAGDYIDHWGVDQEKRLNANRKGDTKQDEWPKYIENWGHESINHWRKDNKSGLSDESIFPSVRAK